MLLAGGLLRRLRRTGRVQVLGTRVAAVGEMLHLVQGLLLCRPDRTLRSSHRLVPGCQFRLPRLLREHFSIILEICYGMKRDDPIQDDSTFA